MEQLADQLPSPAEISPSEDRLSWKQRGIIVALIVFATLLITGIVLAVVAMVNNPSTTETIRDIVIVFLALESFIIGVALVVLIVQLAQLTVLLQQEVKPILQATNETLSTLRGTTSFLSDNVVRPVVKASGTLAALRRALEFFNPTHSK